MKARRLPPPPDLQALLARFGNRGFSAIPTDELVAHERRFEEWRAKMRAGEFDELNQ